MHQPLKSFQDVVPRGQAEPVLLPVRQQHDGVCKDRIELAYGAES